MTTDEQRANDILSAVADELNAMPNERSSLIAPLSHDEVARSAVGIKYDADKPAFHLIPPDALLEVARVFTHGAHKYADRNWEKGLNWSQLSRAIESHRNAFERHEDRDPESSISHLAHLACSALMLLALTLRNAGTDDRSPFLKAPRS